MIDIITSQDLQQLASTVAEHCVSIFLPTHRAGPDQAQDPIRLKNLLARATDELTSLGQRSPDVERLLAPAAGLLHDPSFWAHLDNALALYLSDGSMIAFRLPEPVDELVVTADRFHLKPLIPSLATGRMFYVLALSQHQVRLLRGDPLQITEIKLGDIPHSLAEELFDHRERQLQSHSASRVGPGRITATFHGRGSAKDSTKTDLARFFRAVDDGIVHLISDHSTPLVLAGVDYLLAAYRQASRYPRIVGTGIEGNPEHLSPAELHSRAWPLVGPLMDTDRTAATEAFLAGAAPTSTRLPDVAAAAHEGRVDTLFVPMDTERWGAFDFAGRLVDRHDTRQAGDRDILDAATIDTLTHGGIVYAVPHNHIPGTGLVAATLRF